MLGQFIKLSQFDIELPLPEFVGANIPPEVCGTNRSPLGQCTKLSHPVDRDTAVDEPSSNGAFHLIDPLVKRFFDT